jgi:hypothetical protein
MTGGSYRGVVRGGQVVLLEHEVPLTDGTEVLVTPVPTPGTSAAVLAALEAAPKVPAAWVEELEHLIEAGHRPPTLENPFAEERREREDG